VPASRQQRSESKVRCPVMQRFPTTGGWGYALFNYDALFDSFAEDLNSLADCGHSCHVAVKAKDFSFHPSQKR